MRGTSGASWSSRPSGARRASTNCSTTRRRRSLSPGAAIVRRTRSARCRASRAGHSASSSSRGLAGEPDLRERGEIALGSPRDDAIVERTLADGAHPRWSPRQLATRGGRSPHAGSAGGSYIPRAAGRPSAWCQHRPLTWHSPTLPSGQRVSADASHPRPFSSASGGESRRTPSAIAAIVTAESVSRNACSASHIAAAIPHRGL